MDSKEEELVYNVMPGYFKKLRVNCPINTWILAPANIWVTMTCNPNKQAYLYVSPDNGTEKASVGWATAPATGGTNSYSTFIRKGLYFFADTNGILFYDFLVYG